MAFLFAGFVERERRLFSGSLAVEKQINKREIGE